jgi:hypothetical protein
VVGALTGGSKNVVGVVVAAVDGAVAAVAGGGCVVDWPPAARAAVAGAAVAGAAVAGAAVAGVAGVVTVVVGDDVEAVLAAAMPAKTPTPATLPAATHAVTLPMRTRPASRVPGVR